MLLNRKIAAFAVAAALACGALSPAHAEVHDVGQHGAWSSFVANFDGQPSCGVRTAMSDGGGLAILTRGDEIHLLAFDDNWTLRTGAKYDVTLRIDDETFTGASKATSRTALEISGLKKRVIKALYDSSAATINFGGVVWSLDLTGTMGAFDDMAACVQRGDVSS
jgi:hypothetical protein